MGLFQNRPQVSDPVNYVTVGLNKTLLIVGLGNIGSQYDGTRHNIGFAAVDSFVSTNKLEGWMEKRDFKCHLITGQLGESRIVAIKPTTLMNLSGEAVQAVTNFYKIPPTNIVVVHDELDIDFGQIRTRIGGGSAGHNGIKSVSQLLGDENYGRIRVGIGPKKPEQMDSADFVLQKFNKDEQANLPALLRETDAILSEFVFGAQLNTETRGFLF